MATTESERGNVTVLIEGKKFEAWPSIDIALQMDSFSSVEFKAPFEAAHEEFRETFRPFKFKPLEVQIDGARAFLGTMVTINPDADAQQSVVDVGAYALPAVLNDCSAPASALPFEFKKLGLRAIADAVAKPFGIGVEFASGVDEGTPFPKAKLDIDQELSDFLADLARQRNLVISNTPDGKLLCLQSVAPGRPVARLRDGEPPVTKIGATFSPQDYYSEITGFVPRKRKRKGSRHTERNPFLSAVLRPRSFRLDDTDKGDAPSAVKAKLGRMFGNMASWQASVATWRDPAGNLWAPNTTITIEAPDAMVYREYEFVIRSVKLHEDANETSAVLGLVMPGAFRGEIPASLPWDG